MIIMGGSALVGGILTLLFLPETLGSLMLESNHEVENLNMHTKPFFSWWSRERLKKHLDILTHEKTQKN